MLSVLLFAMCASPGSARDYMAYYTQKPIIIDGILSDQAWLEVDWNTDDIAFYERRWAKFKTRAKVRWDDEFLYLGVVLEEPMEWTNITSTPYCNIGSQRPLITNDEFETLARNSKEFALEHAINVSIDFCLNRRKEESSAAHMGPGMFKALSFCESHTIQPFPQWHVEVAIPMDQLDRHTKPAEGQMWSIGLERVQWAVAEASCPKAGSHDRQMLRKSAIRMFVQSAEYKRPIHILLRYLLKAPTMIVTLTLLFQVGSVLTLSLMVRDLDFFILQFPRKTCKYVRGYFLGFLGSICYKILNDLLTVELQYNWLFLLELGYTFIQISCLSLLLRRLHDVQGSRSALILRLRDVFFSRVLRTALVTKLVYVFLVDLTMISCKLGYVDVDAAVDTTLSYTQCQNMILIAIYIRLTLLTADDAIPLDHRFTEIVKFSSRPNDNNSTCSICLRDYVDEEQLRKLPCAHHFHAECIDRWRCVQDKCPLCMHPADQALANPR